MCSLIVVPHTQDLVHQVGWDYAYTFNSYEGKVQFARIYIQRKTASIVLLACPKMDRKDHIIVARQAELESHAINAQVRRFNAGSLEEKEPEKTTATRHSSHPLRMKPNPKG